MIRVIIADDHQMFTDGIRSLLSDIDEIVVTGQARDGKELLTLISKQLPDIVLMDIEMPNMDGIEATRIMLNNYPTVKVIALTMYKDPEFIKGMLKAGASGYVMKNTGKNELLKSIRNVYQGKKYLNTEANELLIESLREDKKSRNIQSLLSDREIEIIKLLADGLTTKKVAEKLNLSYHTIDTHRKNIILKLGVKNTAELVKFAFKNSLVN